MLPTKWPFNFSDVPDFLPGRCLLFPLLGMVFPGQPTSHSSFFSEAFPDPGLGQVLLNVT